MKTITRVAAILFLVSVGYVVAQTSHESAQSAPSENGPHGFVGRKVKLYFRKADQIPFEHLNGGTLSWISGNLNSIDSSFAAMTGEDGDEVLVPMSSVAYIRSGHAGATSAPN